MPKGNREREKKYSHVIFDSQLALKEQVNKLCQLAYLEIRRIGSNRGQYLSFKTLVSSLVLSILLL